MQTSSPTELWEEIVRDAGRESPLWSDALRPQAERECEAVFSTLCDDELALGLGLETIYEGYLVHYGHPRLFAPRDAATSLLLGDYLYAHGLVRIAATGDIDAVAKLAQLISECAALRADGASGDGEAWARTAAELGSGGGDPTRALALHAERIR